jgi:hypothetical protein
VSVPCTPDGSSDRRAATRQAATQREGQVTSRATPGGIMGCRIRDISNKINASFAGHEHLRELHHISSGFRILTDWRKVSTGVQAKCRMTASRKPHSTPTRKPHSSPSRICTGACRGFSAPASFPKCPCPGPDAHRKPHFLHLGSQVAVDLGSRITAIHIGHQGHRACSSAFQSTFCCLDLGSHITAVISEAALL